MATTLDSMVNLRNPLGLTSLTGSPAKEKPPAPSQAAFPSIERPADPRPEIEKQRGEIGLTSSNIDVQIINNLAQQGRFQGEQAKQKAESEAQSLRELDTSRKALEKSLYESPAYKTIQEKSRELAEKSTFNPDQQNAQTLAAVFSIIGAAGFLLGGNNKNTAKAALAAMNGMAEGYSKGRDQYAKEQRQEFETNQKALRGTLDSLEKAFAYEIEQNKGNIEAATRNAKIAALERDASFINANIDKYGLVSTLEQLRSNKKRLETVLDALQKKEDAYKSTLEKEWFSSEEKKAVAAAAQERVRYQEQERTAREQERRQNQERRDIERREDTQRFQRERDQFRLENRPERGQGAGQTQRATQQQAITQRAVNSLGGVASALETIVELPQGSTTGWLPNLQTKDGMFNAIRNQLGRKISPVDAELMNTTFTGIGRNLAAIESSGLASGLSTLANQMEKGTYISAGVDDPYKVAMKLADIKRIATENIQPSIDSGLMTDKQAKTAQELVNRIEKIIPYNTRDVAIAYREATSRTRGKPTVGQSSAQVVKPGEGWSDRDERRLQELEEKARGSQPK
jgi:hypothetical protein